MSDALDLTTIILTFNEELHLRRCLENARQFSRQIFVVDSLSTDQTAAIAREMGAEVITHPWPGNQAEQFNWALANCPVSTAWILRLDADEYLYPETVAELRSKLPQIPEEITGIVLKRRHVFLGKWVKHGTYPVKLLRIFRRGCGRCEARLMDEHLELVSGKSMTLRHDFVDHNLHDLAWWMRKHLDYAVREAAEMLNEKYALAARADRGKTKKRFYARLPLFWRARAYFFYRYVLRLGFLDGKAGFCWHFFQALWYRMTVDAQIYEIEHACGGDPEKIRNYLLEHYHITLR